MPTSSSTKSVSGVNAVEQLRLVAENLIQNKSAAINQTITTHLSLDVLALLYKSASSQEGNSDALKLLHEFQVHQVELDLQFKQFAANEQELHKEMAYYRSLFDCAPGAYLVTSIKGQIQDGNNAAAELLGIGQGELCSLSLNDFLTRPDKTRLQQQLKTLEQGMSPVHCVVTLDCRHRGPLSCMLSANLGPGSTSVQVLLCELLPSHD